MTVIVGLAVAGRVIIGGDSAAVQGNTCRTSVLKKVFRRGPFLIALEISGEINTGVCGPFHIMSMRS